MAVAVLLRLTGLTAKEHDQVMQELGVLGDEPHWPDGMLNHVAGFSHDDWYVVNTWVTQDDFERFWRERFKPALLALTAIADAEITGFTVHHMAPLD